MTLLDHMAHSRVTNTPCSFPPLAEGEKCPICGYDADKERDRADKVRDDVANGAG